MTRARVRMEVDHAALLARKHRGRMVRALVDGIRPIETVTGRLVTAWDGRLVLDDGERGWVVDAESAVGLL